MQMRYKLERCYVRREVRNRVFGRARRGARGLTFSIRFPDSVPMRASFWLALFQVYSCQRRFRATSRSPGFIAISCVRSIKIPRYARIVTCVTPEYRFIFTPDRPLGLQPPRRAGLLSSDRSECAIRKIRGGGLTCGLRMPNSGMERNFGGKKTRRDETLFVQ